MKYREIADGIFVDRPNRFIAHVEVNGAVETVHVKNTGRCKELLLPGTAVRLEVSDNPKRKTKYDLVLCINHDTSELVDVMTKLISLENLGNFVNILGIDAAFAEVEEAEIINKEKLENSIEDILCEYLDFTLLHSDKPLSLRQRENAVQVLFDKGIFNIKGAIPMVAKYLKISEPSVYRYLKAIKEKV